MREVPSKVQPCRLMRGCSPHILVSRAKVYFQVRFIVIFGCFYTKIRFVALATKIIKNNGVVFFKTIYVN